MTTDIIAESEANALVDRSIATTSIVHAPYREALALALGDICFDSAEDDGTVEFWGDEGETPWRVHLDVRACPVCGVRTAPEFIDEESDDVRCASCGAAYALCEETGTTEAR